jgi:hypothetical protein
MYKLKTNSCRQVQAGQRDSSLLQQCNLVELSSFLPIASMIVSAGLARQNRTGQVRVLQVCLITGVSGHCPAVQASHAIDTYLLSVRIFTSIMCHKLLMPLTRIC